VVFLIVLGVLALTVLSPAIFVDKPVYQNF
jgi:hypothetical protein